MARKSFASVSEYIAAEPEAARPKLRRVRAAIKKGLPSAEESILPSGALKSWAPPLEGGRGM